MAYDDDEDWVGEPPEGRHSRDRAKPGYWIRWTMLARLVSIGLMVALTVLVVVLLLSE